MSEEKNEQIQEEEELTLPEVAEGEEDTTNWKELALKQQGINKRLKTKNEKLKEVKKEETPPETPVTNEDKQSSDLTDGQKALLVSNGVKAKDEIVLAKELMEKLKITSVDELIDDDYFQVRLTKLRETKAVNDAIPSSTSRSVSQDTSSIDYYLKKYESGMELNDVPSEHRSDVLNAHLAKEEQKQMFGRK